MDVRITITINDALFRVIKVRAAEADITVSRFIENAIQYQLLEDLEDIEDARKRKDEPSKTFDGLVVKLKTEGLL